MTPYMRNLNKATDLIAGAVGYARLESLAGGHYGVTFVPEGTPKGGQFVLGLIDDSAREGGWVVTFEASEDDGQREGIVIGWPRWSDFASTVLAACPAAMAQEGN